jgi:hypothetical protein
MREDEEISVVSSEVDGGAFSVKYKAAAAALGTSLELEEGCETVVVRGERGSFEG